MPSMNSTLAVTQRYFLHVCITLDVHVLENLLEKFQFDVLRPPSCSNLTSHSDVELGNQMLSVML